MRCISNEIILLSLQFTKPCFFSSFTYIIYVGYQSQILHFPNFASPPLPFTIVLLSLLHGVIWHHGYCNWYENVLNENKHKLYLANIHKTAIQVLENTKICIQHVKN